MQQAEMTSSSSTSNDDLELAAQAELVAREAGHLWGTRLKAEYLARTKSLGNWPGTLEEARGLVDAALGRRASHDDRELLALLVERGARRAWHAR
jgi:hypothetical protein